MNACRGAGKFATQVLEAPGFADKILPLGKILENPLEKCEGFAHFRYIPITASRTFGARKTSPH